MKNIENCEILNVKFKCKKFDDHKELINYINNKLLKIGTDKKSKYYFRGFSKVEQLYCSLIRKFENECLNDDFCENHEIGMLQKLEQNGGLYFNNLNNVFDFVSTAQHFGLPTRMIDWTTNPFTALLFAVFMNPNPEDGVYRLIYIPSNKHIVLHDLPTNRELDERELYVEKGYAMKFLSMIKCIEDIYLNPESGKELIESVYRNTNPKYYNKNNNIDHYIENSLNKFKEKKILFVTPNFVNERIAAQQGLFQFPYSLDKYDILKQLAETSTIIEIDKSLRCKIIETLEKMGHNIYQLMPDLANMCSAILTKEIIKIG